jgi:hypothetical protein
MTPSRSPDRFAILENTVSKEIVDVFNASKSMAIGTRSGHIPGEVDEVLGQLTFT